MKNKKQDGKNFDIFVIGGGVNGAAILRDAAGRGYNVDWPKWVILDLQLRPRLQNYFMVG